MMDLVMNEEEPESKCCLFLLLFCVEQLRRMQEMIAKMQAQMQKREDA